jgi:hypothetical protein
MSGHNRTAEIIRAVLNNDEQPPDAEYSPSEHGAQIACTMTPSELRELASAALQQLPASLAISFLEGVCETAEPFLDPDLLYDQFHRGSSVDTSGKIVELLCTECHVIPDEIAAELLRRLASEHMPEAQNRLAFGLWVLFCSETVLVREDKLVGCLVLPIDDQIAHLLVHRPDLTQYARECLVACGRGKLGENPN